MTVYLKLAGPNTKGLKPKGCYTNGWQDPSYGGIEPSMRDEWIGLRLDDYVVIDCDCAEAADAWLDHIRLDTNHTWLRKTPHGYHFIYNRPDSPLQSRELPTIHPLMELKTGPGHQIVYMAPGYESLHTGPIDFDPAWLPEVVHGDRGIEEWSEMPDGIGDNAMISFGGKFREWGMNEEKIRACLDAINSLVMTEHPMPYRSIMRLARQAAKYETGEHEAAEFECPVCSEKWEVQ